MSALFIVLITLSAVGLYYSARLEGYCAGLRRREERIRRQMEEHRMSIITGRVDPITGLPQEVGWVN